MLTRWLEDHEVQRFLQINRHQDVLWFNQGILRTPALLDACGGRGDAERRANAAPEDVARNMLACYQTLAQLRRAAENSGFQVERLLEGSRVLVGV